MTHTESVQLATRIAAGDPALRPVPMTLHALTGRAGDPTDVWTVRTLVSTFTPERWVRYAERHHLPA